MSQSALVLGAVLSFAHSDGQSVQLSVLLAEAVPLTVRWGDTVQSSTQSQRHHLFDALPAPLTEPVHYSLQTNGSHTVFERTIAPILQREQSQMSADRAPGATDSEMYSWPRMAVYGDSRDGFAPHQRLLEQIHHKAPRLLLHTGDAVHSAKDDIGWERHLRMSLPITAVTPTLFAIGNHEIYQHYEERHKNPIDGRQKTLKWLPPPKDPLAQGFAVSRGSYHVRVGDSLFVVLDSNASLAEQSAELAFLEAALKTEQDTRYRFVLLHQGPYSSGYRGPHPDHAALRRVLQTYPVTAVFSGHDHMYEQLHTGTTAFIVTGGGGAPLYTKGWWWSPESKQLWSMYHWILLERDPSGLQMQALGLEGAVMDVARLPIEGANRARRQVWLAFGFAMSIVGLALSFGFWRLFKVAPRQGPDYA